MAGEQSGGVQSVERAFELLEVLAEAGGELSLSEAAAACRLPLPTIHRLVRTLVARGYVRQLPSRRYALGPRLINLGESASGMLADWARPCLAELVEALGETANLSMIDGDRATYVAQVPSRHAMRMFTEVGRRVHLHTTGAGKALLAQLSEAEVAELVGRAGLSAQTERSITDLGALTRSWPGSGARATPWTTASRTSACGASPCRSSAGRARSRSRSRGRPPG